MSTASRLSKYIRRYMRNAKPLNCCACIRQFIVGPNPANRLKRHLRKHARHPGTGTNLEAVK